MSFLDPIDNTWHTGVYDGDFVQRTTRSSTNFLYGPNTQPYMVMGPNEAMVTNMTQTTYGYRDGIAGRVGVGMVRGFVWDDYLQVVRMTVCDVKARVALTRRWSDGSLQAGQPDIPAGAKLSFPGALAGFKDGSMIYIDGYYNSAGTLIPVNCYVNTNWASGSTSQYYVQFFNK
ncbi:hypothetical protein [Desulfitobacterium chlororespirans]|uniref:Uncharacterized protein n=1 Tax=Desulfitobacterium chlororespirans DSM 11544 TaxID=1121395 RepID=A0A1M7US79_9FIRM|nr:hypothetical protein [Desulfitobacterium chlororespirans]SHN85809.1 hypothetical protein SAMN02745215_04502 [Desulfitobacterium chlororespirans DSM 11544]